jgi:hypothetical protein
MFMKKWLLIPAIALLAAQYMKLIEIDGKDSDAARYVGILKKNLSRMAEKAENKPTAGK